MQKPPARPLQVFALYERERAHKLHFLRAHCGHEPAAGDRDGGPTPALRRMLSVAAIVMGAFAVAESAARLGRPYAC
jgi:hypothetical protein